MAFHTHELLCSLSLGLGAVLLIAAARGRSTGSALVLAAAFMTGLFSYGAASLSQGAAFSEKNHDTILTRSVERIPFSSPSSGPMLKALVCGDRSELPRTTRQAFRDAGASHILALSGLHLGIIYAILSAILSVLGNTRAGAAARAVIAVAACGCYTLLTGASASVIRAFLFITIREAARLMPHRRCDALQCLCIALTIQLAADPLSARSASFQLSYLAMCGITLIHPWLSAFFPPDSPGPMKKIWEMCSVSISCQAFTAPAALLLFGTFPKHFLLTNLVAMPLCEVSVIAGMGAMTGYSAGLQAGWPAMLAELPLRALEWSLEVISTM